MLKNKAPFVKTENEICRKRPVAGASFLGGISAWVKSLTDLKNSARVLIEISKKKKIQSDKKNTGNTNHKRFDIIDCR